MISTLGASAQKIIKIQDVLNLSEQSSPDAQRAENNAQIAYWKKKIHSGSNKPRLFLNGELPNLSRTIIAVTQNDGSESFRDRSLVTSLLELSVVQNIASTGGTFFASSQISRIDILGISANSNYLAYPILVGIRQPIGGFNAVRWANRIEPMNYQKSLKRFKEDLELTKIKGLQLFFNLLLAQEALQAIAKQNKIEDTLLGIARNRYSVGKITENELLKSELNTLQTKQKGNYAQIEYRFALGLFQNFMGIRDSVFLQIPDNQPIVMIDEATALLRLTSESSKSIEIQKSFLEMGKQLAQARANAGLKMDITLSFGYSKDSPTLSNLYKDPQDQQSARVTFQIPILDWQKGKSEIKVALLEQKNAEIQATQEIADLSQDLARQIRFWKLSEEQLGITKKTNEIAEKSYQISFREYLAGQLTLLELDTALQERNIATQNYLRELESTWISYYKIRTITLYDFEKNLPLD